MGLYNILSGVNANSAEILAMLGLTKQDTGRFRDCHVINGEIAVYTRNGGGNRHCYLDEDAPTTDTDCEREGCYSCAITHRLPQHPNYLRDEDDSFDSTYATIYFSIPKEYQEEAERNG